jgi:hypothetical protein
MNVYLLNEGSRCIRLKQAKPSDDFMKSKISNFEKEVAILKTGKFISKEHKIVQMVNLKDEMNYQVVSDSVGCHDGFHSMDITETQSFIGDVGLCYKLLFISNEGQRTLSDVLLVTDVVHNNSWAIYTSYTE